MKSIRILILEAQLALVTLVDRVEAPFPNTDQVIELARPLGVSIVERG